jgi:hypothetical protein
MSEERQDLLGVVEPPQEPMPFPEWRANVYREFTERHADIMFVDPEAPPGKPCKPIPYPVGEDENDETCDICRIGEDEEELNDCGYCGTFTVCQGCEGMCCGEDGGEF